MKKLFSLMLLLATMVVFTACGGDDDEPDNTNLSKTTYSMYHEDTQTIEGTNLTDIVWEPENEFVAVVENGAITGQYVGKTIVKSSTKNLMFTVEVKPRYHTYEEPLLDWNATMTSIKSKYGTPESENATSLLYKTSNANVPYMLYVFKNGKLYTCGVVSKITIASQLVDFLLERYIPIQVDVNNYQATLIHCYGSLSDPQTDYGIAMQYNSSMGGILVAYTSIDNSKSRSADVIDYSEVFESLENVLK